MALPQDINQELNRLDQSLSRAITANQFEAAREIVAQCVSLHSNETHPQILSILERARRLAIVQRSMSATRLAEIQSATQYAATELPTQQYLTRG